MARLVQLTIFLGDEEGRRVPLPRGVASEVVDALADLLSQVREAEEAEEGEHDQRS
jgi:hypothetical protein